MGAIKGDASGEPEGNMKKKLWGEMQGKGKVVRYIIGGSKKQ